MSELNFDLGISELCLRYGLRLLQNAEYIVDARTGPLKHKFEKRSIGSQYDAKFGRLLAQMCKTDSINPDGQ
ncbi:hypothetical protein CEXT_765591 [Caerostris extrusa]|uniref:Uncharacterized protein n=1 Tax=Caerostris extrusa TaxID=172846 RepID=A0AAV4XU85_CAEEX|nr:hypothetical protein CEXT_765591 [Caerostris extrusa]